LDKLKNNCHYSIGKGLNPFVQLADDGLQILHEMDRGEMGTNLQ